MLLLLTVYFTFALQEVTDTSLEKAQKKNKRKKVTFYFITFIFSFLCDSAGLCEFSSNMCRAVREGLLHLPKVKEVVNYTVHISSCQLS